MTDRAESGRYSLAGFLYQIVGSGVEGLRLAKCQKDGTDGKVNEILELEQLGQDLVVRSADDPDSIRLIQFKYSSTNTIVKPSEMRKILQTFLVCVREAKKKISGCAFEFCTNRDLHSDIDVWFEAKKEKDRSKLKVAINATSQSGEVADLEEICDIFERFKYLRVADVDLKAGLDLAAAKLGMLGKEIPGGVTRLIGFLAKKSAEWGERRVLPNELRSEYAGHPDAFELLSEPSISKRKKDIDSFQQEEARKSAKDLRARIVNRTTTDDIVLSVLQYPVVVVYGDGGCGKSIAVADALMTCLHDQHKPPGFSLIGRAEAMTPPTVILKIADWRNCSNHSDGADFSAAFDRLKAAYSTSPVLVICFDAIDEKRGETLEEETLKLIRQVIRLARESRAEAGKPVVSVVLTCRHRSEADGNIQRNGNPIAPENDVKYIRIGDYDDDEMRTAIRTIDGFDSEVAQRISDTLDSFDISVAVSKRPAFRETIVDVPNEVIELIRHPVLCFVFSQLTVEQQRQCLDGDQQALHYLGRDYVDWFRIKAQCRIRNLELGQCAEALYAAAKTFGDANDIGNVAANWLEPVDRSIGNRLQAQLLYKEAISAGLILEIDQREKTWRWRHPWFCNFLVQSNGVL